MYETFENNDYVYLVMEVCNGGELFYKIEEKGIYYISQDTSQKKSAKIFLDKS